MELLKVVTEELKDRLLLYLVVGGSHAWGLAREDSDFDLVGIYQEPTTRVLEMRNARDNISGSDTINTGGSYYDLQLYEIEKFFRLLCKNNGNMVNMLRLPNPIYASSDLRWDNISDKFITRKLKHYYKGYALSQRKRTLSDRGGKALIYAYRELFSGLVLMRTGKFEFNFFELWDKAKSEWYDGNLLGKYFDKVLKNEELNITDLGWEKLYQEWESLSEKLDYETEHSILPEEGDFSPCKNSVDFCNFELLKLRLGDLNK